MLVLCGLLGGCASSTTDPDIQLTRDWTVQQLYTEARDELNRRNYTRSLKLYELLQSRYPYGRFAQQAQMDTAYAHYLDETPELALADIARFEKQHPNHPDLDYMLYLRGLVLFNEDRSIFSRIAAQDWSDRDPRANRDAYAAFNDLVTRFPESRYADDARERMTRIVSALGGHEIAVARYYMKRGAYLAAANRAQNIVQHFRNTEYVEEALAMMMTAYSLMEQNRLSADARRVLELNYPQSTYLQTGWQNRDSIPWWGYWSNKKK